MRLNKNLVRGVLTGGFLLTTVATTATTAATQGHIYHTEAIMTLRASFVAPRCQLSVPPEVNLGVLSVGEKVYDPVSITINCPAGAVNTGLYAMGVNLVPGANGEKVSMVNVANQAQAELWLKEKGTNIKLDKSVPFCVGSSMDRQCQINPVISLKKGSSPGKISAIINFGIVYP
ncbi:hypothetical protein QTR52_004371 [Salmonella enterica]|nr:hypothetical protein [Salmonella enterica]ELP5543949.1 hypothetical protein [Salmonella enterica]